MPTSDARTRRPLRSPRLLAALAFALTAAAAPSVAAQVPAAVQAVPNVALPGATIDLHSTAHDLSTAASFEFWAVIATYPTHFSVKSVFVQPSFVSPDLVTLTVPVIDGFDPVIGLPNALVKVNYFDQPPFSVTAGVFLLQQTAGAVVTVGQGGTELGGGSTPTIGIDPAGKLPTAGNAAFAARAFDLPTGSIAVLAVGVPASEPFAPLAGGLLALDPVGPLLVVPAATTGAPAPSFVDVAVAIPAGTAGATVTLQWFALDPATTTLATTDALRATL